MVGIVITGHGQFATGLLSSLQLIAGDFANVAAVDFPVNTSTEDLSEKLTQAVQDFANCDKVMFFTDLVGGSPFRCCVLIDQEGIESKIIAGANLPMLLEIVFARDSGDLEVLKNTALEVGKSAIKCFGDETKAKKNMARMGI